MSEESETAEVQNTPETHEHAPQKQTSRGNSFLLVALVIVVVLGAGFLYLLQQQQAQKASVAELEHSIDNLIGVIEKRHQEQIERFKTVPAHQHPQMEQGIEQNGRQLEKLQAQLYEVRNRVGKERGDWIVAEVEYLLRIAQHRLTLERDTHGALAALNAARKRLELQDNVKYAAVITQIGQDANTLSSLDLPDREAMASEITALAAGIDGMPFSNKTEPPQAEESKPSPDRSEGPVLDDSWKAIWQKIWQDVSGLVTIRRDGEAERPMMVPQERYFLRQNLQLKLESARLALLSGNNTAWHDSLAESANWLRRYFDSNDLTVSTAINTLDRLARVELNPSLPDLSDSRQLLQQAEMQGTPDADTRPTPEHSAPAPTQEKPAASAQDKEKDDKPAAQPTPEQDDATTAPAKSDGDKNTEQEDTDATATPEQSAPQQNEAAATDDAPENTKEKPSATPSDVPQLPQGEKR